MAGQPVTVAILAGGRSSRMGTDKSFVRVLGAPMIERVLAPLQGLGVETLIVTNRPADYAYLGLPVHPDIVPGAGALGGVYTAVYHAAQPHALVVACDMPFLARPLLEHLIGLAAGFDVVVPRVGGLAEPLHAVYGRACLEPIRRRIDAAQYKVIGFFDEVRVRFVEEDELRRFDPRLRSFVNINTVEEARRAETDS